MSPPKKSAKSPKSAPLHDEQNAPDHRNLPIDQVGIKGLRYPIEVADKSKQRQHTVATIALTVDLPHHFKGTHMSRFVEVLNTHGNEIHVENLPAILRQLQKKLEADRAHLDMEFPYFIEKKAPVSRQKGLVDYGVRFQAEASAQQYRLTLSVIVPIATLCPCSKAISDRGAHNQRGRVTLSVRFEQSIWIEDLIALVESSASCELYSLLKRPDEKFVTEKAYDNPRFVEDIVRNVALKCHAHPDISWFRVEAENFESIHNHNAYAMIESPKP